MKGIDDTKFIAGAVYVTSILLAVIIVSTYTMKDLVNWGAVVFCTGIIIVTTAILSLVFVPKVANRDIYMETESIFYIVLHAWGEHKLQYS